MEGVEDVVLLTSSERGTDDEFLKHFGLRTLNDLPKVEELESIGLENK